MVCNYMDTPRVSSLIEILYTLEDSGKHYSSYETKLRLSTAYHPQRMDRQRSYTGVYSSIYAPSYIKSLQIGKILTLDEMEL